MTVIKFDEEYFLRCKAKERAEDILPHLVKEATALIEMSDDEKAQILKRKLVREFYYQEKKKWTDAKNDPRFRRI